MARKTILITGGAGFIGSKLTRSLLYLGHRIVVLDCLSPQVHSDPSKTHKKIDELGSDVKFVLGDVTCREDLIESLQGVDSVVHLAAETGTGQSMYAIEHYTNVNIGGTALLLDVIANEKFPIKRLVVASSRAVYGEGKYRCPEHGAIFPGARSEVLLSKGKFDHYCPHCEMVLELQPTDEDSALKPSSVYGVTKLTQEQLVLSVGAALGISAIAFRYQNVYGPGQSLANPYTGILSIFSTRLKNGKSFNIFEDGMESRDFVYIDDVISATILGIEHPEPIVDVFNVGSGVGTSVLDIAKLLQNRLAKTAEMSITGQYRIGDIRHNVADLGKGHRMLGYSPKVSLEVGLKQFVDWVETEAIAIDRYDESLSELAARGLIK
ncbi:NAD-dependent epimerase/dehydratase family protein [Pseudomonadales bacterium]|nr:NAD-dependent epimerase/dehydratase family protein [Pseudomonadales bacterium]